MNENFQITTPAVEFRNISKSFGGVKALTDVSFAIFPGEVHAVVGENGAGKTTLMNLLGGRLQPDKGQIALRGQVQRIASAQDALRHGISVVHQEITLCPNLSIADNLYLGREPIQRWAIPDRSYMNREAQSLMHQLDLNAEPHSIVGKLPVAQRQLTEIARALNWEADIIVMDEPNSALSLAETEALFRVIRKLKSNGVTIIYISHRLEEVLEIGDRITVLRDGQYMATMNRADATVDKIVNLMVGRNLKSFFGKTPLRGNLADPVIEVINASKSGKFYNVSFRAGRGEVLGFAGLQGSGRKALIRCLFGLDRFDKGEILLEGHKLKLGSPNMAIRAGIAFVPEDRRGEGVLGAMTVEENTASVELRRFQPWRVLPRKWMRTLTNKWVEAVDIRCENVQQRISHLSGGNQQKVVLSKWLATEPRLLILEEPTQGIDVGAKSEIYNIIHDLAEQGVTILFVSSELPELMALCSRILVMHAGHLTAEFKYGETTEESIMLAATGST